MTKREHIEYWINSASKDWEVVTSLFHAGNFPYCLFFAHLTLEKLLKAHWIKDNEGNMPPRIHSLNRLISETKLNLSEESLIFLERMNDFQLEGRYPDYQFEIYKQCTPEFTKKVLEKVQEIRNLLIGILQ